MQTGIEQFEKQGFIRTTSGLFYLDLKSPSGPKVQSGNIVRIHYDIALSMTDLDLGVLIDSSHKQGSPIIVEVGVGKLLKGIDEGILGMGVGSLRRLVIPSWLAYGDKGYLNKIPPKSILFVDIKLTSIEV